MSEPLTLAERDKAMRALDTAQRFICWAELAITSATAAEREAAMVSIAHLRAILARVQPDAAMQQYHDEAVRCDERWKDQRRAASVQPALQCGELCHMATVPNARCGRPLGHYGEHHYTVPAPRLLWHDDGNSFMCEGCGAVIPRTRDNPMPTHRCTPAPEPSEAGLTTREERLLREYTAWLANRHGTDRRYCDEWLEIKRREWGNDV